jgi:hypothetical protein
MICLSENGGTCASTGWTRIDTSKNNGNSSFNSQSTLLWRRAQAGDSGPTVTGTAGGTIVAIVGFRGCETSGDPWSAWSVNAAGYDSATLTATGVTPAAANEMVVFIGGAEPGLGVPTFSAYSGTNPTFTECLDDTSSLGAAWQSLYAAYGINSTSSATGNRTATSTQSSQITYIPYLVSLKEPSAAADGLMGQACL